MKNSLEKLKIENSINKDLSVNNELAEKLLERAILNFSLDDLRLLDQKGINFDIIKDNQRLEKLIIFDKRTKEFYQDLNSNGFIDKLNIKDIFIRRLKTFYDHSLNKLISLEDLNSIEKHFILKFEGLEKVENLKFWQFIGIKTSDYEGFKKKFCGKIERFIIRKHAELAINRNDYIALDKLLTQYPNLKSSCIEKTTLMGYYINCSLTEKDDFILIGNLRDKIFEILKEANITLTVKDFAKFPFHQCDAQNKEFLRILGKQNLDTIGQIITPHIKNYFNNNFNNKNNKDLTVEEFEHTFGLLEEVCKECGYNFHQSAKLLVNLANQNRKSCNFNDYNAKLIKGQFMTKLEDFVKFCAKNIHSTFFKQDYKETKIDQTVKKVFSKDMVMIAK